MRPITVPPPLSAAGAGKVRLGDVFDLQMGKTPARARQDYWGGANKWISIADIGKANIVISKTAEGISDKAVIESGIKIVPANTLIMSFKLSIGKTAITAEPMYTNEAIMAFLPKSNVEFDLHYLYHQFSNKDWSLGSNLAVIGLTLNKKSLQEHIILSPPLPTQQRIADELDRLCAMKKNAEDRLAILDQIVKSRFVEMFGGEKWPKTTLGELSEFLTSGSRGWAKYYSDEGELFITIKNVKNSRIMIDDVQHIVPPQGAEADRTRVKEGDLLISITADLGRTGVVTREIESYGAYINQHLTRICLKRNVVDSLYAAFYIESPEGKAQIERRNQSAVKAGLNFDCVRSIQLPLPPIGEQRKFAAFVAEVDKSKLTLRETVATLDQLYRAKLQEYFG